MCENSNFRLIRAAHSSESGILDELFLLYETRRGEAEGGAVDGTFSANLHSASSGPFFTAHFRVMTKRAAASFKLGPEFGEEIVEKRRHSLLVRNSIFLCAHRVTRGHGKVFVDI